MLKKKKKKNLWHVQREARLSVRLGKCFKQQWHVQRGAMLSVRLGKCFKKNVACVLGGKVVSQAR